MSTTVYAADLTADYNFSSVLQLNVDVTVDQLSSNPTNSSVVYDISNSTNRYGTIQFNKRKQFDDNTLARRWEIYSDNSRATVKYMTQQRVRSVLYPTLSLQYPTNDRMLQYKLMPHPVFSVTLKAGTKSARGNIYGQAYCTSFGWSRFQPMRKKGEAHNNLSMVFTHDDVPPWMIVDNSKEQPLGEFRRKCREADCHLVNSEPYSP